jgi:hypothetical protein
MALQPFVGPWPHLQFHNIFLHRRKDSLDGGSARRKAATWDNTNIEQKHTYIHALSGIRPHNPHCYERAKTVHALGGPYTYESGSARSRARINFTTHVSAWRPTHGRVWLIGTRAESDSRARLVRVWAPLDRAATVLGLV